jgi:hypothetical protein
MKGIGIKTKVIKIISISGFSFVIIILAIFMMFYSNKGREIDMPVYNDVEMGDNTNIIVDFSYYNEVPNVNHPLYNEPVKVKGLFVNASAASSKSRLDELIAIADETEINAFVIDVKDDDGYITFNIDHPIANEISADRRSLGNVNALMDRLYEHDIFPIARIVCFKDPYLAKNKTEYAIKNMDGSLWKYKDIAWLNPYNRDSWEYIVDVAKEAAKIGFKEIQFDYIRFEATSTLNQADLGSESLETSRTEIIVEFLDYAKKELEPYNVVLSADVFGIIFLSTADGRRIGQDYVEMSQHLDVISPMVYPSHYGKGGFYGTPKDIHSDWFPYEIIYGSMMNSNRVLDEIPEDSNKPVVRPWLQAFTATYLKNPNYRVYDGIALQEQVQGVYDAGLEEWILWNAGSNYSRIRDGLVKE